jgi:hypothetical protein
VIFVGFTDLPSGNLTVCELEHTPIPFFDLPVQNGDFL